MNVPTVISSICNRQRRHLNLRRVICALLNTISLCVSFRAGVWVLLGSALAHHSLFALMFWRSVAILARDESSKIKIPSVLFAGWPSGSGRPAGFAANWTTAPGRIRLSPHRNGIFQNERGNAVFFLLHFLSINVNIYNVLFVLVWDF